MIAQSFGVAFNLIKDFVFEIVKVVAPVAISIAGVFIAWKLGIKYFKNLIVPDSYDKEGNEKERLNAELNYLKDEYEHQTDNEIFDDDDQWRDEDW